MAVTNEDEAGAVALSLSEPDVDVPITASLTDPDGGLDRIVWSWARSADQTAWTAISGAALASYTPVAADKGQLPAGDGLVHGRARAAQERAGGDGRPCPVELRPSVPQRPERRDTTKRGGEHERRRNRGRSDRGHGRRGRRADLCARRRRRGLFTIDPDTGQIRVGSGTALDHEADKNVYEVTVTATDSLGVSATVTVTMTVANVGLPAWAMPMTRTGTRR